IAGHRDGFFRGLRDVAIGDIVRVRSLTSVASYQVNQLVIVEPTEVDVLESHDESRITLVTCYPFYFVGNAPKRYIVTGTRLASEWAGGSQTPHILQTALPRTSQAGPAN